MLDSANIQNQKSRFHQQWKHSRLLHASFHKASEKVKRENESSIFFNRRFIKRFDWFAVVVVAAAAEWNFFKILVMCRA